MNELDNVDGLVVNALASMKAGNYDIAIENIVLAKHVNKYKSELYVCLAKIFLLMNKNDKALRNILIYFTLERFKEIKKGKTGNSQNIIKKEIYENILWEKEISDGLKVDLNQIPNLKDLLTPYADLLLHPTEIYITGTAFISEHINILENNSIDSSILIRIKDEIKNNETINSSETDRLISLVGFIFIIINLNPLLCTEELVVEYLSNEKTELSTNLMSSILYFGRSKYFVNNLLEFGFLKLEEGNIEDAYNISSSILLVDGNHAKAMFLKGKCLYHIIGYPELHRIGKLSSEGKANIFDVYFKIEEIEKQKTEIQTAIRYLKIAALNDASIRDEAYRMLEDMDD